MHALFRAYRLHQQLARPGMPLPTLSASEAAVAYEDFARANKRASPMKEARGRGDRSQAEGVSHSVPILLG
jgi:hypothetical protein